VAVLNRYIESHLFLQKEIMLWDFNELAMPHGLAAEGQNPDFNRHNSIQILAFNSHSLTKISSLIVLLGLQGGVHTTPCLLVFSLYGNRIIVGIILLDNERSTWGRNIVGKEVKKTFYF
jgi:hypothetical protein